MIRLAVIADPHVHDCDWVPAGTGLPGAIRTFAETLASTRVFNESLPAFRAALTQAGEAGAKVVLLVGDLTDDGQAPNYHAALRLIEEFRQSHGLRVLAVPGNHDLFAQQGRPQVKSFITAEGESFVVESEACPEAATLGSEAAFRLAQDLGYVPRPQDLHWESPFGTDPDWDARRYQVFSPDGSRSCQMIDSSYLIEPVEGLWVLALDSNVAVPKDEASDLSAPEAFIDPTGTGWSAVPQHRPHLLPWITDVARRARAGGKHLVAFSHYPLLDVLAGTGPEELALFGASGLAKRTPPPALAQAFAQTGVELHFSGHLHVNDTALYTSEAGRFCNVSMPSPVGFAPGFKLVDLQADQIDIATISLDQVAGHDLAFAAYQAEAHHQGQPPHPAITARSHGDFLDKHLVGLVRGRYLAREWPQEMQDFVAWARLADLTSLLGLSLDLPDQPLTPLVEDWYRLRKAGALAQAYIPPIRLHSYRQLCAALPAMTTNPLAAQFLIVLRILGRYLDRLPNGDFSLDLQTMTVRAR